MSSNKIIVFNLSEFIGEENKTIEIYQDDNYNAYKIYDQNYKLILSIRETDNKILPVYMHEVKRDNLIQVKLADKFFKQNKHLLNIDRHPLAYRIMEEISELLKPDNLGYCPQRQNT